MAVFRGTARRASACLAAFVCLAQGIAFAQYPNPNYSYLPYRTHHPWAPPQEAACPPQTPSHLVPEDGWFYDSDAQIDLAMREAVFGT